MNNCKVYLSLSAKKSLLPLSAFYFLRFLTHFSLSLTLKTNVCNFETSMKWFWGKTQQTFMGRRAEPTLLQQFLSAISRWRPRRWSICSLASRSSRFLRSLIERGRPSAHWREKYKIAYGIKVHFLHGIILFLKWECLVSNSRDF